MYKTVISIALILLAPIAVQAQDTPHQQLARDIYAELIAIRTVEGKGGTEEASRAMQTRLMAAGFSADDAQVLNPDADHGLLLARLKGQNSGKKPILLMAHLDVVDALREDWSLDPFVLTERDGYFYGRGTSDNKAGAAILTASLIRFKQEGFVPDRDLIVVLTADEETSSNSIKWLANDHKNLIDAEYALNTDGGGGDLRNGEAISYNVQASEKVYATFKLEIRNKGGHSSRPVKDNAIYRLSAALTRLAAYDFPVRLNEITRGYFRESAKIRSGQEAHDMQALAETTDPEAAGRLSATSPFYNALMRTTCVATRLFGGHADNALPQTAQAIVNCRILPGVPVEEVEAKLNAVFADEAVEMSRVNEPTPSPPSPLRTDVMETVARHIHARYPAIPIIPNMSTGATDGLYVRNVGIPVYGIAGIFGDVDDARAHGKDERVLVKEYYGSLGYWYDLLKDLTGE